LVLLYYFTYIDDARSNNIKYRILWAPYFVKFSANLTLSFKRGLKGHLPLHTSSGQQRCLRWTRIHSGGGGLGSGRHTRR